MSSPHKATKKNHTQLSLHGLGQATTSKKYSSSDLQQVNISKALVSLIAGDLVPLSLVDSLYFHVLMGYANDCYQVPSRKHLSRKMIPETSANLKKEILGYFKNTSVVV